MIKLHELRMADLEVRHPDDHIASTGGARQARAWPAARRWFYEGNI